MRRLLVVLAALAGPALTGTLTGPTLAGPTLAGPTLAGPTSAGAAAADPAPAAPDCEALAERAGLAEGIPRGLMAAVARVESGHAAGGGALRAWPWTLNAGGEASFHATAEAALHRFAALRAAGRDNIDLGCMQLNWRWHGAAFPDAAAMLDPAANTRYAARFLRQLHGEAGSWTAAVALYHSRDPARGEAYAARVAAVLGAGMPGPGIPPARTEPQLRGILVVAQAPLLLRAGGDLRSRRGAGLLGPRAP